MVCTGVYNSDKVFWGDMNGKTNVLTSRSRPWGLGRRLAVALLVVAVTGACASSNRRSVPPGTSQPDKFLFDRGTAELEEKHWLTAREFFKQVTETYTQSPLRPEAKLAIGDTYLGENTAESLVLGINEFQEYLAFYPTNPRADYAQFQLGMAHFKQMRAPERDQTETRNTIREFETFTTRYPNSKLLPDVQSKLREARDRLSQSEYLVGRFYFRINWYPGAIERLQTLLKQDPAFTNRDGVYFFLGESLLKSNREAEALPYFEKLLDEFQQSEHLEEARKRITGLKTQAQGKPTS
jgi:outer membrane protein assembly factor BamD